MSTLSPIPPVPSNLFSTIMSIKNNIKSATPDIVVFNEDLVDFEVISDLLFEDIFGNELINISRNDIVNGQEIYYNPIKNLSEVQRQYNSKNILSLPQTSDKYFDNFSIKVDLSIPYVANGPSGYNVYMEDKTGDIIVEAVNLQTDEQIEIQIALDGTIYEATIW